MTEEENKKLPDEILDEDYEENNNFQDTSSEQKGLEELINLIKSTLHPNPFVSLQQKIIELERNKIPSREVIMNFGKYLPESEREHIDRGIKTVRYSQRSDPQLSSIAEFNKQVFSKNPKARRIFHITDTHSRPEDLERILKNNFSMMDFNPKRDIFVHTGDLLEDLIDRQEILRGQSELLLPTRIADEGQLSGSLRAEFIDTFRRILEHSGISEQMLREREVPKEKIQTFLAIIGGNYEPRFLTDEEVKKFREEKKRFDEMFKKAVKNHARVQYEKFSEMFKSKGLTGENLIMIPGNHDVPEVMYEVLSEYMLSPGTSKEVGGINFGNIVTGSTGTTMGPDFSDTFGYTDIRERLHEIKYDTQAFKELKSELHTLGFDIIDDKELDNLAKISIERHTRGIGKGYVSQYFDTRVQTEIDRTVSEIVGKIPSKVPENVDIWLFHGQPNGPFRGLEEEAALEEAVKTKKPVMHGHIHEPTSHHYKGISIINPGHGKAGYGVFEVDDRNEIDTMYIESFNHYSQLKEGQVLNKSNLPPKKEYSRGN